MHVNTVYRFSNLMGFIYRTWKKTDLAATVQRTEDIFSFISQCVCFRIVKSTWKENVCTPLCRMHFRWAVWDVGIRMGYKIGNLGSGLKQLSCPWHFNEKKKKKNIEVWDCNNCPVFHLILSVLRKQSSRFYSTNQHTCIKIYTFIFA